MRKMKMKKMLSMMLAIIFVAGSLAISVPGIKVKAEGDSITTEEANAIMGEIGEVSVE